MFYTLGESLDSLCNNIIANGLSSILRTWIFFFFHPDKWSEWMIRRKYVLGWIFSASPPDPCLTLYFLLQCSRGWLMDVSTGFHHPLASVEFSQWKMPVASGKRKENGVSVLPAQLSACSVVLGWLLSSDQDPPQRSGLVAALSFASGAREE